MTTFKRADRVADLIKAELSDILLRQIRDPRIGTITITGAKVTDDLRLAKVYFVEMGKDAVDPEIRKGLEKATGFLKRELGKRLQLRFVPDLIFKVDSSFAYGSRIDRLLSQIREETEDHDREDS
ncbi:MAG: Ribosome-binding factor A [Syntrophaceae bacterium PtaB.Bin095]|jgi:ribosome-binding factor A|nr:MAG: Ribosome-binding factor A [Syntrophaceae bacterium PtaB.Bin095]